MRGLPALSGFLALAFAATAQAASFRDGALEATDPWSRPAVAGTTGIGYMGLANRGTAADALVAVSSPLAKSVEMHSSSMAGGVMKMKKEKAVALPAQSAAAFAPGAYHLMFLGLTKTVKSGDAIPATLVFASGARLKVAFAVGTGLAPPRSPHADHMQMSP